MPELLPRDNLQRVGVLVAVPGLLRRLGADPADVFAAAGLSSQALENPESTIPYAAAGRLLHIAARKTQCPHFGLLLGEHIGTTSLGLVGELMQNAPTLGIALRDFATHQHRNAHGSVVYLLTAGDQAFFGYAVYQPKVDGSSLICDAAAMAAFNIVRELARPSPVHGIELLLSRAKPRNYEPYRCSLGVKLRFNADQTAALLPLRRLDRAVAGADAGLRSALEQRVKALSFAGELDTVTQLRRALRIGLVNNQISGDAIATQLGLNRRTLHRRLGACGVRFQELLDETRCEFAQQLLANTRLGIGEVGLIIGYSDPGVFTRAFIRWVGVTPSEWRLNIDTAPVSIPSTK